MKFHIKKDLLTHISYFNTGQSSVIGGSGEGIGNLGKRLEWRNQDETWWEE